MAEAPSVPRSFLIADDHPMVRDALGAALSQAFAGAALADRKSTRLNSSH